jgi:GDSL-like Lipase/Acylhydrolase family
LNPRSPDVNSFGMRQTDIATAMLAQHFVVAVIGDSHAYGFGNSSWQWAFPTRLQEHLTSATGQRITVLNFGVPGYNMAQELEVLRAKALPFKPDLIVLQYCINDEHLSNYIQPKYPWLNRALYTSVFVITGWTRLVYSRRVQTTLRPFVERYAPDMLLYAPGMVGTPITQEGNGPHGRPHRPKSRSQVPPRYWDVIGRENLERNVRIFGEVSRAAGIPAVATGFIEDSDKALYESAGFDTYSLFEMFKGVKMGPYGYNSSRTASHFNDAGSDFIAKRLAAFIIEHFDPAIHAAQLGRPVEQSAVNRGEVRP